ncbi:MAG: M42 family peptidase, partial [Oscillospiraceae bacterium]
HIDEIGMIVTYITDEGFLKVAPCGGMDMRLLLAQEVVIHGNRPISGIVCTKPPHLTSEEETKKVPQIDEISIDTGYKKAELESLVSLGDRVTLKSNFTEMLNGKIISKSLDDRACMVCILYALEQLKGKALDCSLTVVFSAQEETGGAGAAISSYKVNPDVAIAVDVSFAHTADADEKKCGKMGKGPMIGMAPMLNRLLSNELLILAKERNIPYQIEVITGRTTGTNADEISISRGGVKTGVLSLPLKYMHMPIEMIALSDVENVGRLLAEYLISHSWQQEKIREN